MGIGDTLRGLFSRRDAPGEPFVLKAGEAEVARAVGTWRAGTLASIDGDLILTTQRLVFVPDTDGARTAVLAWTVTGPHPSRAPSSTIGTVVRHGTQDAAPPVGELAAVEVGAAASLTGPPSLILVDLTGGRIEIGILANRLAPNLSAAHSAARDRMVATVRSAMAAASPARPEHGRPAQRERFSWFTDDS